MRKNYISMRIIEYLSDGKLHTYQEIANGLDIGKNTVVRHIQDLSTDYNIVTYHGGKTKGIQMLGQSRLVLSEFEKSVVIEALVSLNRPELNGLINKFRINRNR